MIELRVLGSLDLRDEAGSEIGRVLAQPKRLALLAYLTLTHSTQQRDSLLALFWPELDDEHARLALRQSVHFLRGSLGTETIASRSAEDLALAPGTLRCDALEFERALDEGRLSDALELYRGDLLPGFHADDIAPELQEWLERERLRLRDRAARAAWALAEAAERESHGVEAAHRARQAVQFAPDDEAGFRRLVTLLDRLGDRNGALRAYDEFARRLRGEFGVEPAAETRALIEAVRSRETIAPEARAPVLPWRERRAPSDDTPLSGAAKRPPLPPRTLRKLRLAILGGLALLAAGIVIIWAPWSPPVPPRTIAVGFIQNEAGDSSAETARILTGVLATDLARVRGLSVVSDTRLYEILGQLGATALTRESFAEAARRAGAVELIEGVLSVHPGSPLRLELRRVNAVDGAVRESYTADGSNAFELADRVTARVAETFALTAPGTPLATTAGGTLVARRLVEEGLRASYRGDASGANDLFAAAVREDSTFAMAAYYLALAARVSAPDSSGALLARANQLADHAPEHDRLLIRLSSVSAEQRKIAALADSLVARYPNEPDGYLALGTVRALAGDFLAAIDLLRRVIAMDSLSLRGKSVQCRACDAYLSLVGVYESLDSFPAAERTAREWIRLQPARAAPWDALANALTLNGRWANAVEAHQRAESLRRGASDPYYSARFALLAGNYDEGDSLLAAKLRFDERDNEALWLLVISLRNQGRLNDAMLYADRTLRWTPKSSDAPPRLGRAQVLYELGRYREAALGFESIAPPWPAAAPAEPGLLARQRSWPLTHAATAWAAAGDTERVAALGKEIEAVAHYSSYARDWRLPHHVRGLLWKARGRNDSAVVEFRRAIYSPTFGYTRTNLELARALLALGRADEAAAILQSSLRGSLDGSNLYVTRTELHELLGQAFEAAGRRDSAITHYRSVVAAWRGGDPAFRTRAAEAARRINALGGP
jgi:DNA-binding SARP family transcriptional activator/TolB-like protein